MSESRPGFGHEFVLPGPLRLVARWHDDPDSNAAMSVVRVEAEGGGGEVATWVWRRSEGPVTLAMVLRAWRRALLDSLVETRTKEEGW